MNVTQKNLKYCFIIFLFVLSTLDFRAQTNLVPNPSFEDTLQCPFNAGQIAFASPWSAGTVASSTDYFNSCNSGGIGVPINDGGHQFPRTGNAYAGLYMFFGFGFEWREYIQVKLISQLNFQKNYKIEFYVSLADTISIASNISLYFSDTAISELPGQRLNVIPQFSNDLITNPLIDKNNWIKVSGIYTATGTENYITFGNFYDNAGTDTIFVGGGSYPGSYYYLDDVSISCIDCNDSVFIPNIFSPNNDNQNDYIDFSNLNLVEEIVDIYNRWGNKVFQSSVNVTKWDGRDLKGNDCSEGVYYYVFHYAEFINKELDRKGFIQLVR